MIGMVIATATAVANWSTISAIGVDDVSVAETGMWAGGLGIAGLGVIKVGIAVVLVGILVRLWHRVDSVKAALPSLKAEGDGGIQTGAIKTAFGEEVAREVTISSTKSMTGHLLGAAGAIEAVICALAIRDGVVPPTINYTTPDPNCDLNYTPNTARKMEINACISNSLGFGGHNVTLCLTSV